MNYDMVKYQSSYVQLFSGNLNVEFYHASAQYAKAKLRRKLNTEKIVATTIGFIITFDTEYN